MRHASAALSTLALGLFSGAATAADQPYIGRDGRLVFPEGADVSRALTPAEAEFLKTNPIGNLNDFASPPPTGPVRCAAEYEPMDGILLSWKGSSGQLAIVAEMAAHITTTGDATAYVTVQAGTQATAQAQIAAAGANMSRVQFFTFTTDTIWIRDYGPRYVFEGDCRAIVDHIYNRPRPNDDNVPAGFAAFKRHAIYGHTLVHGGGNYHLDALARSYATKLIWNENTGVPSTQIHDIWQNYLNVDTTFFDPFPVSVDLTQHLDMWMQIVADNKVVIGDWSASNPGSVQDTVTNAAAVVMASKGYTVYRVPSRSVGGVHYTFTNTVMCNNLILVPTYTNTSVSGLNAGALALFQAALPDKTVIGVPCQNIIASAGAMHCVAMHIPKHRGAAGVNGLAPTAYLKNLNGGETLTPGSGQTINWNSDDDKSVSDIDLLLSTDGGATYPTVIASHTADDGSQAWNVPANATSSQCRLRVVAHDADTNTGFDVSDANFRIAGSCAGDTNGDGLRNFADLNTVLGQFGESSSGAAGFLGGDANGDGAVNFADLNLVLGNFGAGC